MKATLILVFIYSLASLKVYGQTLDYFDCTFELDGLVMENPYYGGFNNPQFSNIDLNRDGIMDLVVFDRYGQTISPFLWNSESNSFQFAPDYRDIFPDSLRHWMLLEDYNKDGVMDIFTAQYVAGSGIRVFKGSYDTEWRFDLVNFINPQDGEADKYLHYTNFSGAWRNLVIPNADIPAFDDVDFDGDLDLVAFQESGNNIYYFKNTALEKGFSLDSLHFQLEEECWGGMAEAFLGSELFLSAVPGECADGLVNEEEKSVLHALSTLTTFDLDGDKDLDILIGDADLDSINLLINTPSDNYDWHTSQTRDFPFDEPISLSSFLAAYLADIDNDGLEDLLFAPNQFLNADVSDPVRSYHQNQNIGFDKRSTPLFDSYSFDFGANSYPMFIDYNQDGLTDLVIGNYGKLINGAHFSSLSLFENKGTFNEPAYELVDEDWLSMLSLEKKFLNLNPCKGDLDGDGDIDIMVGTNEGSLIYYENIAGANELMDFNDAKVEYQDIRVTLNAAPFIIDLDEDGLSDLVLGDELGQLYYLHNDGVLGEPEFNPNLTSGKNVTGLGKVIVIDPNKQFYGRSAPVFINVDDELKCVVSNINGEIKAYEVGVFDEEWPEIDLGFNDVYEGANANIDLADINSDGILELAVGNERGGLALFSSELLISSEEIFSAQTLSLKLSPNPTTGILNIGFSSNEILESVSIYDELGIRRLTLNNMNNKQTLDLSFLNSGVYFVEVLTRDGNIGRDRILKM